MMRFYFQDSGQKVATKCIRVASDATSQAVIETLIEKFRPDMRMLSVPEYALYEIHENGGEHQKRSPIQYTPRAFSYNPHFYRDNHETEIKKRDSIIGYFVVYRLEIPSGTSFTQRRFRVAILLKVEKSINCFSSFFI